MIVIHTSDWHLGKNRKYDDYLEQQRLMLSAIYKLIAQTIKENPTEMVVFLMAGDLYDRNEDTDREEYALPLMHFFPKLDALNSPNFIWYFIKGNHDNKPFDPCDPHASSSLLCPLEKLYPNNIASSKPKRFGDWLLVPFGGYKEQELKDLIAEYGHPPFIVAHECLNRISTDVGWSPDEGKHVEIEHILDDKISAVFMGDIHRSQCLDAGRKCWYSGSPVTLDYGHKLPKGVLMHHFDDRVRSKEPYLVSLLDYEKDLRVHYQLGILEDPENLPMDILTSRKSDYIQVVVTPEVYAEINKTIPDFFEAKTIAWEYPKTLLKGVSSAAIVETESANNDDYYKPLICEWIKDNGEKLTQEERDECFTTIMEDFKHKE